MPAADKESVHGMNAQGNNVLPVVWMHEKERHVHVNPALHAAHNSDSAYLQGCVTCVQRYSVHVIANIGLTQIQRH